MELLGWVANILAVIGWLVNIKYRKYAMIIFTVATILSLIYFFFVWQPSFFYRSVLYLFIDFFTMFNIFKKECL